MICSCVTSLLIALETGLRMKKTADTLNFRKSRKTSRNYGDCGYLKITKLKWVNTHKNSILIFKYCNSLQLRLFSSRLSCRELNNFVIITQKVILLRLNWLTFMVTSNFDTLPGAMRVRWGEQVGSSFGWTPIIFLHKFRLGGEEIKKGGQGRKGKK